jgi:hypothetical protein
VVEQQKIGEGQIAALAARKTDTSATISVTKNFFCRTRLSVHGTKNIHGTVTATRVGEG